MNILVAGVGYVGTTTSLLLAELGWRVTGFDTNEDKIQALRKGELPFYEPGLDELLKKQVKQKNIAFHSDMAEAVQQHDVIFICVGTPSLPNGEADLTYVQQVAEMIGSLMQEYKLIIMKSTVPVGTQRQVVNWIRSAQFRPVAFDVVSNPEFLREGNALYDAFHPDRIVIGSDSIAAAAQVESLYEPLNSPVLHTSPSTAEMIKYASNSFLAAKISYMNELARLCDRVGVSIADVAKGMGYDPRIGSSFLQAGIGYGGSCFPKDVKSLLYTATEHGIDMQLLKQVVSINTTQVQYALDLLQDRAGTLQDKSIAVLGLAFKPGTDDMREAPSLSIIAHLLKHGAKIKVHDPIARLQETMTGDNLAQVKDIDEALRGAEVAIICTEWSDYAQLDWQEMRQLMKTPVLLDGRNMLDGKQLQAWGYRYIGIGNG